MTPNINSQNLDAVFTKVENQLFLLFRDRSTQTYTRAIRPAASEKSPLTKSDYSVYPGKTIGSCQRLILRMNYHCAIWHPSDYPYYRSDTDGIYLPAFDRFRSSELYYLTLFTQLIHSTGRHNRLNRVELSNLQTLGYVFYSREVLIASLGAAYLSAIAGINKETMPHTASFIRAYVSQFSRLLDPVDKVKEVTEKAQQAVFCLLLPPAGLFRQLANRHHL